MLALALDLVLQLQRALRLGQLARQRLQLGSSRDADV
jgi:hypothetical protein